MTEAITTAIVSRHRSVKIPIAVDNAVRALADHKHQTIQEFILAAIEEKVGLTAFDFSTSALPRLPVRGLRPRAPESAEPTPAPVAAPLEQPKSQKKKAEVVVPVPPPNSHGIPVRVQTAPMELVEF